MAPLLPFAWLLAKGGAEKIRLRLGRRSFAISLGSTCPFSSRRQPASHARPRMLQRKALHLMPTSVSLTMNVALGTRFPSSWAARPCPQGASQLLSPALASATPGCGACKHLTPCFSHFTPCLSRAIRCCIFLGTGLLSSSRQPASRREARAAQHVGLPGPSRNPYHFANRVSILFGSTALFNDAPRVWEQIRRRVLGCSCCTMACDGAQELSRYSWRCCAHATHDSRDGRQQDTRVFLFRGDGLATLAGARARGLLWLARATPFGMNLA